MCMCVFVSGWAGKIHITRKLQLHVRSLSTRDKGLFYTLEPLYKGQVGDGPLSFIQWSLSTRDKLGMSPLSFIQWSLSTRDKLGMGPLSFIQWSLSTRDKLGMGPLSFIQWSLSTRDKLGMSPLSFIQWNLSIRDKLGTGPYRKFFVPLLRGRGNNLSFIQKVFRYGYDAGR